MSSESEDVPENTASGATELPERLQKVLARVGFGSRRTCEEIIADGRVRINGSVAELGARVNSRVDLVEVDGVAIGVAPDMVYYLVNKPAGVVTTSIDTHGRPTVVDLVPPEPRVFSVGRLDMDTEGLLILTNDGTLAQHLSHPSHGVDKEYLVQVVCGESGVPDSAITKLRNGVDLEDGRTAPARVSQVSPGVLRVVLHEGRNRQVRRMCEAVGHPVTRLVRTRIGGLVDNKLRPGEYRSLSVEEVRGLYGGT